MSKVEASVFPAYAGMFPLSKKQPPTNTGFPRIRGDVPVIEKAATDKHGFSPHTRGCSAELSPARRDPQVFPAYAGMFPTWATTTGTWKGFPRIRGDIPEARPAMRKILLKKFSQQGSLLSFQTFRSGDRIKLAPTFTKPKVDFLCPN